MRVSKSQIVHGLTDYIRGEILPKLGDNKSMQIVLSIALNAAMANNKLIDTAMHNGIVLALLDDDGSGSYEISGLIDAMRAAIEQYGNFPVHVPPVPLISPQEITLKLGVDDIDAIHDRIINAV